MVEKMSNPNSESLWQQFLQSIYDDNYKTNEDEEEEVNDPEYSISEDLLDLDDDWDFRDERAFKVSDYELDLLLDEDENEIKVETIETAIKSTEICDVFDQNSVAILLSQLSQHIQLLTQTYLQSFNMNGLQSVAKTANSMLTEINEISKSNALFNAININSSVELISKYPINKSSQMPRSMTSWRTLPVPKEIQKIYISNVDIFSNSCLLPFCGFSNQQINKNKCKTSFTLAEDHLIALGLEQFSPLFSLRKCYRYLKQLLLPTKTVDQIRTHIKNIKRRSNANETNENPIMYYYLNGKAPPVHRVHCFHIDSQSDAQLSIKSTPEWYKKFIKTKLLRKDNRKLDSCSDPKKLKASNYLTNDKKKYFVLPIQSPVKQTNSIVKKYKYLNRLNQFKGLSVVPNSNSKTKKLSNIDSNSTQLNCLSADYKSLQKVSEAFVTNKMTDKEISNKDDKHKTRKSNEENQMNSLVFNNQLNESLNEVSINEEDVEYDDESDLAALMTASSTITTRVKLKPKASNDANNCSVLQLNQNKKEGRKSLAVKQRESTLQLLSFESNEFDSISQIKQDLLIHNFLEKVRKSLSQQNYVHFLSLLSDFHQKTKEEKSVKSSLIKDIFTQIEDFLKQSNVNKDIISEFVLFLSAEQAEECGKMFEYLYWRRVFNFICKLEKYSQIDGQCLSRFYRCLNQLKTNSENCDENRIQWTVSRCVSGHSYLMHHFSSLLMNSKPSEYLFEDQDFDEMIIDSSDDEERIDFSEKTCFETINIPESDDDLKYGTNECPCSVCHNETNQRHCTSCSIRFIGGRVYLTQNHKKLCLAEIHFTECDSNAFDANNLNENIDEDMRTENNKEIDFENTHSSEKTRDKKSWTISEDKMLLELCRSKVLDEKHNDLSEEIFEEVANKLSKNTNEVIARFNKLMELFATEQDSHPI